MIIPIQNATSSKVITPWWYRYATDCVISRLFWNKRRIWYILQMSLSLACWLVKWYYRFYIFHHKIPTDCKFICRGKTDSNKTYTQRCEDIRKLKMAHSQKSIVYTDNGGCNGRKMADSCLAENTQYQDNHIELCYLSPVYIGWIWAYLIWWMSNVEWWSIGLTNIQETISSFSRHFSGLGIQKRPELILYSFKEKKNSFFKYNYHT